MCWCGFYCDIDIELFWVEYWREIDGEKLIILCYVYRRRMYFDTDIELSGVKCWWEISWETLIILCVTYIDVRCTLILILNYLELNVDERFHYKRWQYRVLRILIWNVFDIDIELYGVEFLWEIWWETLIRLCFSCILMKDLIGTLVMWCVKSIGSSSAGFWSKV